MYTVFFLGAHMRRLVSEISKIAIHKVRVRVSEFV